MQRKSAINVGAVLPASMHSRFDTPIKIATDSALILPDLEAPFQASDFVNKVLDLAATWGVKQLILAGDAMHWESLSGWGANWTENKRIKDDKSMLEFLNALPEEKRAEGVRLMEQYGIIQPDNSVSGEIAEVRMVLRAFNSQFDNIHWVLGNHEDRLIRKLEASLSPTDLLQLLDVGNKWSFAPYYYALLYSGGQTFRITHPRSAGNPAAVQIAIRQQQHVIMGHSHKWKIDRDPSGRLWAIHSGHCVSEDRLCYASVRDRGGYDAHALGAVIVRDGYPFVLSEDSPFDMLKKCR